MVANSIAPREWKTGPEFISGLTAAEVPRLLIHLAPGIFVKWMMGTAKMQTATDSMEITSEIMSSSHKLQSHSCFRCNVQLPQLLKTAFLLSGLSIFPILHSDSLCITVQTNTPELSKRIQTTWPYQHPKDAQGYLFVALAHSEIYR